MKDSFIWYCGTKTNYLNFSSIPCAVGLSAKMQGRYCVQKILNEYWIRQEYKEKINSVLYSSHLLPLYPIPKYSSLHPFSTSSPSVNTTLYLPLNIFSPSLTHFFEGVHTLSFSTLSINKNQVILSRF